QPDVSYTTRLTEAPTTSVSVALVTDGQTDIDTKNPLAGGRISLQPVGGLQPTQLFKGNITITGAVIALTSGPEPGNFFAAGFAVGQLIRIAGTTGADGDYSLASIAPDGKSMTLATAPPVGGPFNGVVLSRLLQQGSYTGKITYTQANAAFLLFQGNVQI